MIWPAHPVLPIIGLIIVGFLFIRLLIKGDSDDNSTNSDTNGMGSYHGL